MHLIPVTLVTVTTLIVAMFSVTATASPAAAATVPAPGWVALSPRIIGDTPIGFQVWVDPAAPHHAVIAAEAAGAVATLRSYGLDISWRGYGRPSATAEGNIGISEGSRGCAAGVPNRGANTSPFWKALPNGDLYMTGATTVLCPNLYTWSLWQWGAILLHELGHAMGLGHVSYSYAGTAQLMNPVTHFGVTSYRQGDIDGLRWLAHNGTRVKAETPPAGLLESSRWNVDNTITLKGWALLQYYLGSSPVITVTDNGRAISRTGTTVLRLDVNKTHDMNSRRLHGFAVTFRWPGGQHTYCVTAASPLNGVSIAKLGCVRFA